MHRRHDNEQFYQICSRQSKVPIALISQTIPFPHNPSPLHQYLVHPDDSTPVVRNIHLGPNTGIYIPCESGFPLYTNVLALRLDVRRGCQVALVEQIHKIYSVLPCPSPTSNLLFQSLEVREFPPFCHKRGYPPLLSPQPLAHFTPLIPCKIQKGF